MIIKKKEEISINGYFDKKKKHHSKNLETIFLFIRKKKHMIKTQYEKLLYKKYENIKNYIN